LLLAVAMYRLDDYSVELNFAPIHWSMIYLDWLMSLMRKTTVWACLSLVWMGSTDFEMKAGKMKKAGLMLAFVVVVVVVVEDEGVVFGVGSYGRDDFHFEDALYSVLVVVVVDYDESDLVVVYDTVVVVVVESIEGYLHSEAFVDCAASLEKR
jgi:hypothetical protein